MQFAGRPGILHRDLERGRWRGFCLKRDQQPANPAFPARQHAAPGVGALDSRPGHADHIEAGGQPRFEERGQIRGGLGRRDQTGGGAGQGRREFACRFRRTLERAGRDQQPRIRLRPADQFVEVAHGVGQHGSRAAGIGGGAGSCPTSPGQSGRKNETGFQFAHDRFQHLEPGLFGGLRQREAVGGSGIRTHRSRLPCCRREWPRQCCGESARARWSPCRETRNPRSMAKSRTGRYVVVTCETVMGVSGVSSTLGCDRSAQSSSSSRTFSVTVRAMAASGWRCSRGAAFLRVRITGRVRYNAGALRQRHRARRRGVRKSR